MADQQQPGASPGAGEDKKKKIPRRRNAKYRQSRIRKKSAYPTLRKLNNRLGNKYPLLTKIETSTGIPKHYILILGVFSILMLIFWGTGMSLVCAWMGFCIPVYRSFKALKQNQPGSIEEVAYWIKFWIIWMMFTTIECFSDTAFSWVPLYYAGKFAFLLWCFLPNTQGANFVYERILRPFLNSNEKVIEETAGEMKTAMRLGADKIGKKMTETGTRLGKETTNQLRRKGKRLARWSKQFTATEQAELEAKALAVKQQAEADKVVEEASFPNLE